MNNYQLDTLTNHALLVASMTDHNFISSGLNNRVWRISGTDIEGDYIIRVSIKQHDLFTNPDIIPVARPFDTKKLDAHATQSLVGFFVTDPKTGHEIKVADIQEKLKGDCLGLTTLDMKSRYTVLKGHYDINCDSGFVKIKPNPEAIQKTNAYLFGQLEYIASAPLSFYKQFIRDVLEIEEAGYELDPSKSQNFSLINKLGRIGFCDLSLSRVSKLTPDHLACILWQPGNQTWHRDQTEEEKIKVESLREKIFKNMIMVCDGLGISFSPVYDKPNIYPTDYETLIREKFGLPKPDGLRPIILNDQDRPIGCGLHSSEIIIQTAEFKNFFDPPKCNI